MNGIGERLRIAREEQDISLDTISQQTNLKKDFLIALEEDDYQKLPTMIHAKGFLKTYAQFLGLDVDDILSEFSQSQKSVSMEKQEKIVKLSQEGRPKLTWTEVRNEFIQYLSHSQDKIKFFVIGLLVILVLYYGASFVLGSLGSTVQSVRQWASSLSFKKATTTPSSQEAKASSQDQSPSSTKPLLEKLSLNVSVDRSVWMSLTADGAVLYEGVMPVGMTEAWTADNLIEIKISDAAGVSFELNGDLLDELKDPSQKITRISISKQGIEFK